MIVPQIPITVRTVKNLWKFRSCIKVFTVKIVPQLNFIKPWLSWKWNDCCENYYWMALLYAVHILPSIYHVGKSQNFSSTKWSGNTIIIFQMFYRALEGNFKISIIFQEFNPLSPDIKMHILFTVLHRFLMEPVRRICLNIKTSYPWWSLPLFSSLECLNE